MLHSGDSLMVISQSGETADTIAALRLAKSRNCRTIAVCNVIGSTIARDAETVLFTYAGPEIAVAATKSYLTQLAVLYLTALDLAEKRGTMSEQDVHKRIDELFALPGKMQQILDHREQIQCFASKAFSVRHVFFIGRGIDYALSMEAALKLKEISYIHSEAYAAGELKHGTIALIEEGSLVVALATQPALIKKTSSNMEEVRVRGAHVLAVTNGESDEVHQGIFYPERLEEADKYTVFLDGNHSIVRIQNPGQQGKLLVIRDSYSNCLGGFLAESYAEVVLIDLRYYRQAVSEFVKQEGFDNILVCYNCSNFLTDTNLMLLR